MDLDLDVDDDVYHQLITTGRQVGGRAAGWVRGPPNTATRIHQPNTRGSSRLKLLCRRNEFCVNTKYPPHLSQAPLRQPHHTKEKLGAIKQHIRVCVCCVMSDGVCCIMSDGVAILKLTTKKATHSEKDGSNQ